MKKIINKITYEVIQGNIVSQPDIDSIVNAANAQLISGGGVAGAIHKAAGPGLAAECRALAPIQPGEAVISSAQKLPNKYIIHCLGPIYGIDKPEEKLLSNCYANALKLANKHKINSIAFPAISTGIFGYPFDKAADIAIHTVINTISKLNYPKQIRFILFSENNFNIYVEKLNKI